MRKGPWVIEQDSEVGVLLDIRRGGVVAEEVEMRTTFGDRIITILWSREEFFELARDVWEIRHELLQEEGR